MIIFANTITTITYVDNTITENIQCKLAAKLYLNYENASVESAKQGFGIVSILTTFTYIFNTIQFSHSERLLGSPILGA